MDKDELKKLKDAIVVYQLRRGDPLNDPRVSITPTRRVFYIDTGKMPQYTKQQEDEQSPDKNNNNN